MIKKSLSCFFIGFSLILSACNMPHKTATQDISGFIAQTQTSIAIDSIMQHTVPVSLSPTIVELKITLTPIPVLTKTLAPSSIPTTEGCTNRAKFINETTPDSTVFAPDTLFMKTWVFQNIGTCTWTPDYELIFQHGEQMGGTSPSPIGETVLPESAVEVNVPLTAPETPGIYQGYWKLKSNDGIEFGLGDDSSVAFWVKIIVEIDPQNGKHHDFNFGSPTRTENFKQPTNIFPLGSDTNTNFKIKNNQLEMTAFSPAGDHWRVAKGFVDNFAFEVEFNTTEPCSGKDSYGMIVRAPSQPDNIIDSGYVFSFSCDGAYRIYRMDNGNYTSLVNWTPHAAINKGGGKTNKLGIVAQQNNFQLYSNGILLYEFIDSTYPGGLYGLSIRSNKTENYLVYVQEISYWNLEDNN